MEKNSMGYTAWDWFKSKILRIIHRTDSSHVCHVLYMGRFWCNLVWLKLLMNYRKLQTIIREDFKSTFTNTITVFMICLSLPLTNHFAFCSCSDNFLSLYLYVDTSRLHATCKEAEILKFWVIVCMVPRTYLCMNWARINNIFCHRLTYHKHTQVTVHTLTIAWLLASLLACVYNIIMLQVFKLYIASHKENEPLRFCEHFSVDLLLVYYRDITHI